ncbi:DUF5810 domain-containing protein [Haloarcula litorea]|uniref:DUF5810 domain-containing protein n=1 Tax=Haloarcula litorea TaxID=3032579 RepID=UPI0023E8D379|nr:DUF5810 domain-containing protein [Halomicroarcula sp. GDY20]
MGYACPVCGDPQADAGHLANHLAFTAMTGGDDHEAWLDDHVEGWGQLGETELAEAVVDRAEETEYPQVFEESGVDDGHAHGEARHGHDHGGTGDLPPGADSHRGPRDLSEDDREVLAEARDLTRAMLDEGAADDEAGADGGGSDGEPDADGGAGDDEAETE